MKNDPPLQLFIQRLEAILPQQFYHTFLQSLEKENKTIFRVNRLQIKPEKLLDQLKQFHIEKIDWLVDLYRVPNEEREALTKTPHFQKGEFYIQNPSSLLAVLVLDPKPNEEVLDLAAAPGGKTIFMAERMQNQGRIAAVEKVKSRFFKLLDNLKRHGVTNAKTYLKDGSYIWRYCESRFDKVLLDAPCSSEARIRKNVPSSYQFWSERKIKEMQRKQKRLLYSAIRCLKPGGRLVYSTCSFAPEENEAVINAMLKKFENINILPIHLPINNIQPGLTAWKKQTFHESLKNTIRILPNDFCHGFFICLLTKKRSDEAANGRE